MAIYNPDFAAPILERRKREEQADANACASLGFAVRRGARSERPGRETVRAVFNGDAAEALRKVALGRREDPAVLAVAIVERALRDGTAEELLGDARAEDIASGFGKRPIAGLKLTRLQCAVVYLIGGHGGMSGWCAWSGDSLAKLLPPAAQTDGKYVSQILAMLANRGILERQRQLGSMPRACRLTELGRAVYVELAGDADG